MIPVLILAAVSAVFWPTKNPEFSQSTMPCDFRIVYPETVPEIVAPPEILPRLHVLRQFGSQVAVVRVDFIGSVVTLTGKNLAFDLRMEIEVQNVSDRLVSNVQVVSRLRLPSSSAPGGLRIATDLAPGQKGTVNWSGKGSASPIEDDEAQIFVFVDSLQFDGCVAKPARALPIIASSPGHDSADRQLAPLSPANTGLQPTALAAIVRRRG